MHPSIKVFRHKKAPTAKWPVYSKTKEFLHPTQKAKRERGGGDGFSGLDNPNLSFSFLFGWSKANS